MQKLKYRDWREGEEEGKKKIEEKKKIKQTGEDNLDIAKESAEGQASFCIEGPPYFFNNKSKIQLNRFIPQTVNFTLN